MVTIVFVASSFTCQLGVFVAERGGVFGLRRLVPRDAGDGHLLRASDTEAQRSARYRRYKRSCPAVSGWLSGEPLGVGERQDKGRESRIVP